MDLFFGDLAEIAERARDAFLEASATVVKNSDGVEVA
jgi:hypothetical protein